METLRLRRIQELSHLERLLDAYISRDGDVPYGSYQLRDPKELPKSLRAVLAQAVEQGGVWSCWVSDSHLWFFTGPMPVDWARELGAPVIELRVYGEDAELKDSSAWRFGPRGTWTRCADVESPSL